MLGQGAILGMALWLLYMSDSKTSLACFAMTTGLVAAHTFLPPARKRAVLHILVVAVVLCSFSVLFLGIGSGALETLGRNSTLTGRTEMWDLMLQVPINPVFGTGFESYWLGKHLTFLWQYQIMNGITEAHNGYLETYLNLGWAGLALLAVLFWTGYRNILRLLETDPEAGRLRLGFLVIAIVYNFTEAGIRTTDLVWIALILAIAAFPQLRAAKTTVVEAPPAVREPEEVEQFA
jgi:O-antigen ligase